MPEFWKIFQNSQNLAFFVFSKVFEEFYKICRFGKKRASWWILHVWCRICGKKILTGKRLATKTYHDGIIFKFLFRPRWIEVLHEQLYFTAFISRWFSNTRSFGLSTKKANILQTFSFLLYAMVAFQKFSWFCCNRVILRS